MYNVTYQPLPSSKKKPSRSCCFLLKAIASVFVMTFLLLSCSDVESDEFAMNSLRGAMKSKDYGGAKQIREGLKTDSFQQLALKEFPNLDQLYTKQITAPYTVTSSIIYPKNQAGISALVHTVLVDSLYLEEVEYTVLNYLSEQYDDGNSHQIYLHTTQPPKLEEVAKTTDRIGVIEFAKKGAFGYIIQLKGSDATLMRIDKNGDYVNW